MSDDQMKEVETLVNGPLPTLPSGELPEKAPEPEAVESEQASSGPEISDDLRERAEGMGFSEGDFKELGSERITSLVDAAEKRAFEAYTRMHQQQPDQQPPQQQWQQPPQQQWQQPPQQGGPPAGNQPVAPGAPAGASPASPFKLDLDPDLYDEGIIAAFQDMAKHYEQQIATINQTLQGHTEQYYNQVQHLQQQQEAEFAAWFDEKITSELGDDSVFGKGDYYNLPVNSPARQAREDAIQRYQMWAEFQQQPAAKNDELLNRFLRAEYGGTSNQQKQLSEQLKSRSRNTIGRPSGRKTKGSSQMNHETGLSQETVDEVQRMINDMQAS